MRIHRTIFMAFAMGLTCLSTFAASKPSGNAALESNKTLVKSFMTEVFAERNVGAAKKYLSVDYNSHNVRVGPGEAGFEIALHDWFEKEGKDLKLSVVRVIAEGDLVVGEMHISGIEDGKPVSLVGFDLFKIVNGNIAEHWETGSKEN